MKYYSSIKMKVNKDIYCEVLEGRYINDGGQMKKVEKRRWTTNKDENANIIAHVKEGRFLSYKGYWYSVLNPVTDEDKKNSIMISMDEIDSVKDVEFPLAHIDIHPYELNELIKEGVIEII